MIAPAPKLIVGAGLAGLIAAAIFPRTPVIEASPAPVAQHRALLRFRSDAVSRVTGVPFRRVRVTKAVVSATRPLTVVNVITPADANNYAFKVTGAYSARSIRDLAPVDRWVAPPDFYERLCEAAADRIVWGVGASSAGAHERPLISTIPLPAALAQWLPELAPAPGHFKRASIVVRRWRLSNTDLHQTLYVACPETTTYRLSITGALLIVESMLPAPEEPEMELPAVLAAFGLDAHVVNAVAVGGAHEQRYGKIAPIDETLRRELVRRLTTDARIYSLGRFATWRNLLLDDVVSDADSIRALLNVSTHDPYAAALHAAKAQNSSESSHS